MDRIVIVDDNSDMLVLLDVYLNIYRNSDECNCSFFNNPIVAFNFFEQHIQRR